MAAALCLLAALLIGCGGGGAPGSSATGAVDTGWEPKGRLIPLTLPDGTELQVELRLTEPERNEGMMYRPQLPLDRGMLFVFEQPDQRPFWMWNTNVPLDIIWLDDAKRIVEIYENAPPCPTGDFRQCPQFGGNQPSVYVLELAAGQVARHGLKVGDKLEF